MIKIIKIKYMTIGKLTRINKILIFNNGIIKKFSKFKMIKSQII